MLQQLNLFLYSIIYIIVYLLGVDLAGGGGCVGFTVVFAANVATGAVVTEVVHKDPGASVGFSDVLP